MSADGNDMEETKRHPGGRPTDYRPEYCDIAMDLGRTGASKVEIAVELGCDRKTLDRWAEANPEFRHAFTRALELSQVWWERKGRDNLEKPIFQSSMWSRSMAARFPDDWREVSRQESSGVDGKPIENKTVIEWVVKEPTPLGPK